MVVRNVTALALTGLLAMGAAAQNGSNGSLDLQPESRLWVEGTSTVRGFTCQAPTVNATVSTSSASPVSATLAGEKAVTAVRIEVPARSLDCNNGTMNNHMMNALKASEHPSIVFRMTSYDLATQAEKATVRLQGRLTLGGQERPVSMTAEARPGPNGTLRIVGAQDVRLTEHGLRPPSLMMGTMKVGDVVKVNFDLILKP
jgi:polyisoprenoid-binding protein YceI